MGFLCNISTNKRVVDLEVIKETELLRDLGLNNVYNINTDLEVCREVFLAPEFYVTGVTKLNNYFVCPSGYSYNMGVCVSTTSPYTATTSYTTWIPTGSTTGVTSIVYNLDYTPDINISFILTGNTEYTGYTGNFGYKIFSDQRFVAENPTGGLVNGSEIINSMNPFNGISGNVITQTFPEGSLPKTWSQYLIRPYYNFFSKDCSPGLYFSEWDNTTQLNAFQTDNDYYFITVIDPPVPQLASPNVQPIPNYNFIQDILLADGKTGVLAEQASVNNVINYFILKSLPGSDIMVFLNGVKMTQGYDYNIIQRGPLIPPVVEFLQEIKITDWIVANYIVGLPLSISNGDYSKWFVKTIIVDNISIDATVGYVNQVNYNTITGNYEIYIDQPIDRSNTVVLTINGVDMVENRQFYLSTTLDNRIILDKTYVDPINIGDIISVFGVSPNFIFGTGDYGSLTTDSFTPQWSTPTTIAKNVSGKFIVQIVDINDINYNFILYQNTIDYAEGQSNYSLQINNISLNQYYRFRVLFEATYTAYLENKITTSSYSEGTFDTTSGYINSSY